MSFVLIFPILSATAELFSHVDSPFKGRMENETAPVVTTAPNNLRVAGGSIIKPLAHPKSTIHTIKVVKLNINVVFVALFAEISPSIPSRTTKWRSKSTSR